MTNCLIGQSGGPTAAINATLCGVIRGAAACEKIDRIYGCVNGIQGFLQERLTDLGALSEEALGALRQTPAAYLGSCRYKLPADGEEVFQQIFSLFEKYHIGYFFYIGGNDSMDTVLKLSQYAEKHGHDVKVVGVPKTIDNDLAITDHTPGFGSAAKYVAASVLEVALDSAVYDTDSVTILEIMGRNAGWLTASSALARAQSGGAPHLIYLPERDFSIDAFLNDVKRVHKSGVKNMIVAISEGIRGADGTYVCESMSSGLSDIFGHKYLSGAGKVLEAAVREHLGFKARAVELNVLQRCAGHLASETDLRESEAIGRAAAEAAAGGTTGKMMVFTRTSDAPYAIKIEAHAIGSIANEVKLVPDEYINAEGNDVTEALLRYAKPLIEGEPQVTYQGGLPVYLRLK